MEPHTATDARIPAADHAAARYLHQLGIRPMEPDPSTIGPAGRPHHIAIIRRAAARRAGALARERAATAARARAARLPDGACRAPNLARRAIRRALLAPVAGGYLALLLVLPVPAWARAAGVCLLLAAAIALLIHNRSPRP